MSEENNNGGSSGCSWIVIALLILGGIGYCIPEIKKNWECCCSINESMGSTFGGYTQCDNYYDITESEAKEKCKSSTYGVSCSLFEK